MYIYAQLDENNICIGVSRLSGPVNVSYMIPVDSIDSDKIWRKYENGQWSEGKYEPETTAPLNDYETSKQRIADLEDAIAAILGGV